MHTGRSSQTARVEATQTACCGSSPNIVVLSGANATTPVELVRCIACGVSAWHVEGVSVARERALAVLADTFAGTTPRPAQRQPRRAAPPRPTSAPRAVGSDRATTVRLTPAAPAPIELADLLAGWQVHGSTS